MREVTARKPRRTGEIRLDSRAWRTLRDKFKAYAKAKNMPCWYAAHGKCLLDGMPINYDIPAQSRADAFETDHKKSRKTHPHLTLVWSNLAASHCTCNRTYRHTSNAVVAQQDWVKPKW